MKKILHLSYSFKKGGAAKASSNIIECLDKKKYTVQKYSFINVWRNNKILFLKILFINFFFKLIQKTNNKKSFNIFNLNHKINKQFKYDFLHLHWLGNEFFSLKEILLNDKKIVWTVHDDWLKNITNHIGKQTKNSNFFENYFAKKVINFKKKIYKKNITYVAPSVYIYKNLKKKINGHIYLIQHPINEKIFYYSENKIKKFTFNIGGSNVFFDLNKGSGRINNLYKIASHKLNNKCKFIFFGSKKYDFNFLNKKNIILKNYMLPREVANIFRKSNFTFVLSKVESFSLIAAESLMCGCPVVCYKNNAVSELVNHKKNGYILENDSKKSLEEFFNWIKKNSYIFNRKKISLDAKRKFSYEVISKKYSKLYEK